MSMITVQLQEDGPITEMDEADLVKREGGIDNDDERTTWVEYRLKSDPDAPRAVHRSVNMHLKKPMVWGVGEIGNAGS
ncbi:MAG: hypothetical protein ABI728_01310 [Betaproteobacteria bacterium]